MQKVTHKIIRGWTHTIPSLKIWASMSNALAKSRWTTSTARHWSNVNLQSFIESSLAVIVDFNFGNHVGIKKLLNAPLDVLRFSSSIFFRRYTQTLKWYWSVEVFWIKVGRLLEIGATTAVRSFLISTSDLMKLKSNRYSSGPAMYSIQVEL